MAPKNDGLENLPPKLAEYIRQVVKRIRFSRRVRREVIAELTDHFSQALTECDSDDDRQKRADELIAQFGDASVLGALIRRGKKRCRPRWQKALIRTAQGFGAFIVFMFVYGFWFISGEPTIRIDYLAQVNRNSRPAVSDDQNAWPFYEKALKIYQKFPRYDSELIAKQDRSGAFLPWEELPTGIDPAEYQIRVRGWVEANQPVLQQLALASQKGHFWLEYKIPTNDKLQFGLLSVQIPGLNFYQRLRRLVFWQAWFDFQQGKMDEGMGWIMAYQKMGKHLNRPRSTLIEQLVGIAINKVANEGLVRAQSEFEFTPQQLANIQGRLEALYRQGYPPIDTEFERINILDLMQRCFTESGFGGGHLVLGEFMTTAQKAGVAPVLFSACFVHARRDETYRVVQEHFDLAKEMHDLTPYQLREKGLENTVDQKLDKLNRFRYFIPRIFLPALEIAGEQAFKGKASHEATITILALKRWQKQRGEYPESLNELVTGGFLRKIPDDPYSAGPLVYRREGDDFTLYSVGRNFADDGGKTDSKADQGWGHAKIESDKIFWPLPNEKYRVPAKSTGKR